MEYTNVSSPKWANAEHTIIECIVDFHGVGPSPFSTRINDTCPHGIDIFKRCLAGDFGAIATYVAPIPTQAQIDAEAIYAKDAADLAEIKAMPFVNFLATHNPAQIANRITSDLAADGVQAVLIKMAKVLGVLAKEKLR